MPGLGFAQIRSEKPLLFISDIQASLNFNLRGWEKMLRDVRRFAPFSSIIIVGDILENVELYREQYEKALKMKVQHAVIRKLLDQLINAAECKNLIIVPGNHDVVYYGQDLGLEVARKLRDRGCNVGYASESVIIRYFPNGRERNIFCIHKLGRSHGSQVAGLTYTIYRNALEFIQLIQLQYRILINDVIYGHLHRPVDRQGSIRFHILGGWNRDRFYLGDPSTVLIMEDDQTSITLSYPQTLDLEENAKLMREFAKEAIEEYTRDIVLPKPSKMRIEEKVDGGKMILNEELKNLIKMRDKVRRNFAWQITEALRNLHVKRKGKKIIIWADGNSDAALDITDLFHTLNLLGIRHESNIGSEETILNESKRLWIKIIDVDDFLSMIHDKTLKARLRKNM